MTIALRELCVYEICLVSVDSFFVGGGHASSDKSVLCIVFVVQAALGLYLTVQYKLSSKDGTILAVFGQNAAG